jgi:NADH-quinone oxidoreductase subunit G
MPIVTIDDQQIEVPDGTTILQAARMIGGDIVPPAMCYYSKLKTSGGYCRTCLVKVEAGSAKDPRPMPKPVASCNFSRSTRSACGCGRIFIDESSS